MASDLRQKTQDSMDALRAAVSTCNLAMLTDSETGLVLCTDTDSALGHDVLERISEAARADMNAPFVDAMATDDTPVSIARIEPEGWTVALRTKGGDEILICRCAEMPDHAALDGAAKAVFDILSPAAGA